MASKVIVDVGEDVSRSDPPPTDERRSLTVRVGGHKNGSELLYHLETTPNVIVSKISRQVLPTLTLPGSAENVTVAIVTLEEMGFDEPVPYESVLRWADENDSLSIPPPYLAPYIRLSFLDQPDWQTGSIAGEFFVASRPVELVRKIRRVDEEIIAETESEEPTDVPNRPTNARVLDITDTAITAVWEADSAAVSVSQILLYLSDSCVYPMQAQYAQTSFTFTGLFPRTPYSFNIRSLNSIGWSEYSDCVSVCTVGEESARYRFVFSIVHDDEYPDDGSDIGLWIISNHIPDDRLFFPGNPGPHDYGNHFAFVKENGEN